MGMGLLYDGTAWIWTDISLVDLGGSLAVASRGLFSTGVSTDLNGRSRSYPRDQLAFAN